MIPIFVVDAAGSSRARGAPQAEFGDQRHHGDAAQHDGNEPQHAGTWARVPACGPVPRGRVCVFRSSEVIEMPGGRFALGGSARPPGVDAGTRFRPDGRWRTGVDGHPWCMHIFVRPAVEHLVVQASSRLRQRCMGSRCWAWPGSGRWPCRAAPSTWLLHPLGEVFIAHHLERMPESPRRCDDMRLNTPGLLITAFSSVCMPGMA